MQQAIGNSLGNYIDKAEPKVSLFSCARICVEVDLEKGLPKAVSLFMDGWEHMQKVDYEQLPFKCKKCHEYGHLVKIVQRWCKKSWEKTKRKAGNNKKGEEKLLQQQVRYNKRIARKIPKKQKKVSTNNQFEALLMEEGEIPPLEIITYKIEEEEAHATTSIPPMSPKNERSEKAPEGSTTPGGTWAKIVKNNRVTSQGYSLERSPSQGS